MLSLLSTAMSLMLVALFSTPTHAWWRMGCGSRLVMERADPIVAPGQISSHVHTIHGGNGFGLSMNFSQARKSTCSTCEVSQDASNYWVPQLYFHAPNGSYIEVPLSGTYSGFQGGITVYYLLRGGPTNDKLHAFPEGFRMMAGHYRRRKYTGTYAAQAIQYQCLDYAGTQGGSIQTNYLPKNPCPNGIRAQVFFPQCWDGKNLDSPNHRSHMSYPASQAYTSGPCPASHPVHMPSLFYEVIFESDMFKDQWYKPEGQDQPFVLAQGDPTGYGLHGDFYNGWDVDVLQKAIDTCTDNSGVIENCPVFQPTLRSFDEMQSCKLPNVIAEDVVGPMDKLPGCNPIQSGPGLAKVVSTCPGPQAQVTGPPKNYVDLTKSKHWEYVGCGTDNVDDRTFKGLMGYNDTETVEKCVDYCIAGGYTFAGLEYKTQCFCGDSLPTDRAPKPGVLGACSMPCAGNKSEFCGGANALSIYKACGPGPCVNAQFSAPGTSSGKLKRDVSLRRWQGRRASS